MKVIKSIAFVGCHLPRRCGIATFTHDIHSSVAKARPDLKTVVVAMTNRGANYDYPDAVGFQIRDDVVADYIQAAAKLNAGNYSVVSLQHEYGIFGGAAGSNVIELISRLHMPVVTTLHTVLAAPDPAQRSVMQKVIDMSAKIVVMSQKAKALLCEVHGTRPAKIEVIPHGVPDFPYCEPDEAKAKLNLVGRSVVLTFGLLSPGKGIENVIDAMPETIKACPNAVYVVLGATHPNLIRDHGEAYRDGLTAHVARLGMENHVVFVNQFVDLHTLLDYISACDVYVTPYLNEAQMTSGTLAYSFGLGKAVVSTPYWHAKELLADGLGVLVPFAGTKSIGLEISSLLTNDGRRNAMRMRAYAASRSMTWARTALRYATTLQASRDVVKGDRSAPILLSGPSKERNPIPELKFDHILAMCDSTGILQHAVHCVPDRAHGYCIDDNARALLLSSSLCGPRVPRLPANLTDSFAAFVQHAWNPDTRRFRNFMSYDRRWLEDQGSEDSHGRTLWALAVCAAMDPDPSRKSWAADLFMTALSPAEHFISPRAWAFTLLGLNAYCAMATADTGAARVRGILANRLFDLLCAHETPDWVWFEDVLAYDNARLPQALLQTGLATHNRLHVEAALRSLRWLLAIQISPKGCFRPVGSDSFGQKRKMPEPFDQQAIEATAMIAACLEAWRLDHGSHWAEGAERAFDWFMGGNDLNVSLVDPETGSCRDGLHADRANENRGAESVLCYLLALAEIRDYKRALKTQNLAEAKPKNGLKDHSNTAHLRPGGHIVSIPVSEPPSPASATRSSPRGRQAV